MTFPSSCRVAAMTPQARSEGVPWVRSENGLSRISSPRPSPEVESEISGPENEPFFGP